jgi:hypothetical protein
MGERKEILIEIADVDYFSCFALSKYDSFLLAIQNYYNLESSAVARFDEPV